MKILIISVLNDFFLHCFLMNDRNKLVDMNYFVSCDHITCPKIIFSCEILKFSAILKPYDPHIGFLILKYIDLFCHWQIFYVKNFQRAKINHICLDSFCHFLTHHYEFSLGGDAGNKRVPPAPPGLAKLYSIIVNWPWRLLHEVSKCFKLC